MEEQKWVRQAGKDLESAHSTKLAARFFMILSLGGRETE